jgi:hypothetical protein
MAGTGRKTFTAGAVLAAADVQSYLQDQSVMVFDSSAARSSAIGTAVSEGMVSYLKDTDLVESYNGSAWSSVAPASTSGLNLVTPVSIANSGGSASLSGGEVTLTGITSISLNGVFTSTYENYLVIFQVNGTTDDNTNLRLRVAGTDATTNYNRQSLTAENASITGVRNSAQSTLLLNLIVRNTTNPNIFRLNIGAPALARNTALEGSGVDLAAANGDVNYRALAANHSTATAYDGFTFYPSTGAVTGTIRVYGYKNS